MPKDEKIEIYEKRPIYEDVPLRVMIYQDIKRYIKPILIIVVICIAIYLLWDWAEWYIFVAIGLGAVSARLIVPVIGKKLMSYAAVIDFELNETGNLDRLRIDLIPMPRFMKSLFIDAAGYPAALNAPLATRQGPAYIVERSIYQGEPLGPHGEPALIDIHEVNPIHRNTEFLKRYKTAFLQLRKDALQWLHELNTLRLTQKVEIAKGYTYRTKVFAELADKELYQIEEDPIMWRKLQEEIEKLKEELKNQKPGGEEDGTP